MKKSYRYILAVAVAILTLSACCSEDPEPKAAGDCPSFSAFINGVHTRAADDYWEINDRIGISGDDAVNICYLTQINDTLRVENPERQIYFQTADPVKYTAYYPYSSSRNPDTGLISISTADQTNQKNFDFLWAEAVGSKTAPNVTFNFTHRMSKVSLVFLNGKDMDVSTITRCRLNGIAVEGTFDTTTGLCKVNDDAAPGSTAAPLSDVRDNDPVTPIFLFPQQVEGTMKLEIYDSDNRYFACNLTIPDHELVAGTNYQYMITVNSTGLKVTDATLSDWITTIGEDSEASSADE